MIEKTCDNCVHNDYINLYGNEYLCCENLYGKEDLSKCYDFAPKEELVRQDERENIRQLILNSNFYIEDDNGKTYDVLVNELKPKMIDTFEESIRQDEREKILVLLKDDLKDYKELREEYKDNKNLLIEDTAIIVYINSLINTIENQMFIILNK